jgi:uncharacterized membrane protein (UPF0127 family)
METVKIKLENLEIEVIYLKDFSKYRGLMLRREGNALIEFQEEKKYKIWMLFVFYPLDLIFLSKDKKVVEIIENAVPVTLNPKTWKLYKSQTNFKYILELDSRKELSKFFRVGDVLEW